MTESKERAMRGETIGVSTTIKTATRDNHFGLVGIILIEMELVEFRSRTFGTMSDRDQQRRRPAIRDSAGIG